MNPRIYIIICAVILLCIVCFFTARIYIYGFKLGSHPARGVLIGSFVIAMSYLGSLFAARNANRAGKTFYQIINVVAGIFFYLFIGAVVLGIIAIAYALKGADVPLSIAWGVLVASILSALIGFLQARRIVTTRYTVTLPGAPASWNGKTAAMISDTHFGLVNYTKFAHKITDKILSLQPDFVLHAGDFYDGPIVPTAPITEVWKKITSKVPLFYTPGNHEAYGDYAAFVQSVRDAGATVLDNKMTEYDGVQIAGTLYHPGKEPHDIGEILETLIKTDPSNTSGRFAKPTILINHPPTAFAAPHEYSVNLIVSGHTHQGQFWPLRYITHRVYGKYDYGMHPYKNLTSITSNGIGTYGPPMRLFNSPEVVLITFQTE